jgi:hypothetical protein
MHNSSILD